MNNEGSKRREPRPIKGSKLVIGFFLTLILISVVSYVVFRYVLSIPAA